MQCLYRNVITQSIGNNVGPQVEFYCVAKGSIPQRLLTIFALIFFKYSEKGKKTYADSYISWLPSLGQIGGGGLGGRRQ